MSKPIIVLVSVLKPIDDTRLYEKIGLSLGESNKYEVNIIGFRANKPSYAPNINFFPLPFFKRLSFGRIRAHWSVFRQIIRLRPGLVILASPELLYLAPVLQLFTGCKFMQDVQENYTLNIRTQAAYGAFQRITGILLLTINEWIGRLFVRHYLLAEKIYVSQLHLPRAQTVLENKFSGKPFSRDAYASIPRKFLFSGTLARQTGTLTAIEWTGRLRSYIPDLTLMITGYAADDAFRQELLLRIKESPWVECSGIDQLVPHHAILEQIRKSDAGIICYEDHPSIRGKVPTKLFEYLALSLPVVLESREEWQELTEHYQAAIPVRFDQESADKFIDSWTNHEFYPRKPGTEVCWNDESVNLLQVVNNVLQVK